MATGRIPTTANSPLTVKGDLFGYSTTQARVAVGNDGETLVADSSTSTGLRYGANFAAGKNKIINGDFGVWQRGTSFSFGGGFGPDRFLTNGGWTGGTVTCSQQAFTLGAAPVAGYESRYFCRTSVTGASGTGLFGLQLQQKIENVQTFAGQTVTVSFWAKTNTSISNCVIYVEQFFGTGGSPSSGVYQIANFNSTTSWARYSATFTLASIAGKTLGTNNDSCLIATVALPIATNGTLDVWGVQVEAGSTATAFQTATGTIQGELAACQRYYVRFNSSSSGPYAIFTSGGGTGATTNAVCWTSLPVEMRIVPTTLEYGGSLRIIPFGGAESAVSSISFQDRSSNKIISITYNGSGMTAGLFCYVRANNDTTAYLGISAEL